MEITDDDRRKFSSFYYLCNFRDLFSERYVIIIMPSEKMVSLPQKIKLSKDTKKILMSDVFSIGCSLQSNNPIVHTCPIAIPSII